MNLRTFLPDISVAQWEQLETFCREVQAWNRHTNLVSQRDSERLWTHQVLPSLAALRLVDIPRGCCLLDMGSGGGFPAIPLKIVRPDLRMWLVDSVRKKKLFLQRVIAELNLSDVEIINERLERLPARPGEAFSAQFEVITARALAEVPQLIRWGSPLLQPDGFFLFWKGSRDIPELEKHAEALGYRYQVHRLPRELHQFSPKFPDFCLFEIHFLANL